MAKTKLQPHENITDNNWEIEPEQTPAPEPTVSPDGVVLSYSVFVPDLLKNPLRTTLESAIARAILTVSDNGVDLRAKDVIDWGIFPDRITVIFRNGMKIVVPASEL